MIQKSANNMQNPFHPHAGCHPPVLAGRGEEQDAWRALLSERQPTTNLLICGLHGLGKTSLLEDFATQCKKADWLWASSDLSKHCPTTEEEMGLRVSHNLAIALAEFEGQPHNKVINTFNSTFESAPGLASDKLKSVISQISKDGAAANLRGLVLAIDEAHLLHDNALEGESPFSVIVETINTYQKTRPEFPILLVLCGLPHLLNTLGLHQSYSERMFQVTPLYPLGAEDTLTALKTPLDAHPKSSRCPVSFIEKCAEHSYGYPCFIQYFGHELFEAMYEPGKAKKRRHFPSSEILMRLNGGAFDKRWRELSENERAFLNVLARLSAPSRSTFTVEDLMRARHATGADCDHEVQILTKFKALQNKGLLYPSRSESFSFAIPMMERMIKNFASMQLENGKPEWAEPKLETARQESQAY